MHPQELSLPLPDLTSRPFSLAVSRQMGLAPDVIYRAWTELIDHWFAAPGTVYMQAAVNTPFFFETAFEGRHHPHYGRFLRLETNQLIEITWLTAGTQGYETIVTVALTPQNGGTYVHLTHSGFPDELSKNQHADAWPLVLAQLEERMQDIPERTMNI